MFDRCAIDLEMFNNRTSEFVQYLKKRTREYISSTMNFDQIRAYIDVKYEIYLKGPPIVFITANYLGLQPNGTIIYGSDVSNYYRDLINVFMVIKRSFFTSVKQH